MNIKNFTTDCNGLCSFVIVYNGSAGLEKPGYRGISHLIEHCSCENVKPIEKELQELGISWNAYTNDNEIGFIIQGLVENVKKIMCRFSKAILEYKITEDVFEREKKVVLTEYNISASDQWNALEMNFYRRMLGSCGPIGYADDISSISFEDFMKFRDTLMKAPTYISFTHPKDVPDLTSDDLSEVAWPEFNDFSKWNEVFEYKLHDGYKMENNSTFDSQRILLTCIPFVSSSKDSYQSFIYSNILRHLLTSGLTSILMTEIREKLGYVYGIYVSISHYNENDFLFKIISLMQADKLEIVKDRLKEVIDNIFDFITEENYCSALNSMHAQLKTQDCVEYLAQHDEAKRIAHEVLINDTERLKQSYSDFIAFVEKLDLKSMDYFVDTDFCDK